MSDWKSVYSVPPKIESSYIRYMIKTGKGDTIKAKIVEGKFVQLDGSPIENEILQWQETDDIFENTQTEIEEYWGY